MPAKKAAAKKPAKKAAAKPAAKPREAPRARKPGPNDPLQETGPPPPPPAPAVDHEGQLAAILAERPELVTRAIQRNPDLIPPGMRRDPRLDALAKKLPELTQMLGEIRNMMNTATASAENIRRIIRRTPIPGG